MTLHPPFAISARLLPALRLGDGWLSMAGTLRAPVFYLDVPGAWEHTIDDLRPPAMPGHFGGIVATFDALLSFMDACAESVAYADRTGRQGENADLFPAHVARWLADNAHALTCARLGICAEDGCTPREDLIRGQA